MQTLMTGSISTMLSRTILEWLLRKEHVLNSAPAGFWPSVVLYGVCVCLCILTDKQDEVEFPHCCWYTQEYIPVLLWGTSPPLPYPTWQCVRNGNTKVIMNRQWTEKMSHHFYEILHQLCITQPDNMWDTKFPRQGRIYMYQVSIGWVEGKYRKGGMAFVVAA